MSISTASFKQFIRRLAELSAETITPWFFNQELTVDRKADETPVTIADRRAEELMRDLIRKTYPSHGIIGEEFGEENHTAEFVWVLDPIDGTNSFAGGCPLFGTLICLLHQGRPVLGAVNLPVLEQLCLGDNETTVLNGKPTSMRPTRRLSEATLLTTDILNIRRYQQTEHFETLLRQTRLFRTWGDCYGYVLLAGGWADIMLDPIMNPWDLLPVLPIIRGAGGIITTWDGSDALQGGSAVAANPQLHSQVLQILNPVD